jgi:hypothetical protein
LPDDVPVETMIAAEDSGVVEVRQRGIGKQPETPRISSD